MASLLSLPPSTLWDSSQSTAVASSATLLRLAWATPLSVRKGFIWFELAKLWIFFGNVQKLLLHQHRRVQHSWAGPRYLKCRYRNLCLHCWPPPPCPVLLSSPLYHSAASQPFTLGFYTEELNQRNGDTGFKLDYTQVVFSVKIYKFTNWYNLFSYLANSQTGKFMY